MLGPVAVCAGQPKAEWCPIYCFHLKRRQKTVGGLMPGSFSPWIALVGIPAGLILLALLLAYLNKPKDE